MAANGKTYLNLYDKEAKAGQLAMDKKMIEEFRRRIQQKLKDPSMAKKAALIIEQMIGQTEETKNSKKDKKTG